MDFSNVFVQEFISNPFLINDYKFDITVAMVITSILPLKIYILDGKRIVTLRLFMKKASSLYLNVPIHAEPNLNFCMKKFHPFNASDRLKYVMPPYNLQPVWDIPGCQNCPHFLPIYRRKDIINTFIRARGHNPRCSQQEKNVFVFL